MQYHALSASSCVVLRVYHLPSLKLLHLSVSFATSLSPDLLIALPCCLLCLVNDNLHRFACPLALALFNTGQTQAHEFASGDTTRTEKTHDTLETT